MLSTQPPRVEPSALMAAVVVCTSSRRRVALLRACVAAVLAGERQPDELIVVVDSNPALGSELAGLLPSEVRLLGTERQGLSGARNVGIAAARSDVVAFVDDDATVDVPWLSSMMDAFAEHPEILALGGPVVPVWDGERAWMCDELLWVVGCTYSGHRQDVGPIRNPIGCNMAFRRRDLIAAGGFATGFGKRGTALETCDETELGMRLESARGPDRIRYVPQAGVHHFVPQTRVSWRHLVRRSLAEGLAKGRLQRIYRRPALGPERSYVRLLVTVSMPRLLRDAVRRRDRASALSVGAILVSLLVTSVAFVAGTVRERARQLGEHVRVPLHRDGYALALNSAFTAATGLLYWILAAKTYSTAAVGLNSALVSSMMFLAGIASLNLPNILVRFLPESGHRARSRVIWAYGASVAFALGASAVFVLGAGAWAPRLRFLRSDHGLQAWFLCSTTLWCLFMLQDGVLTALGRAVWVPVENAVFSVTKICLLAALATLVPVYGIFVSWTLAMLVSVIGVNVFIFARLMRPLADGVRGTVVSVRDRAFARYFTADWACSVASLSTANLMPVIVTAVAGATTNAYWAMAYAVSLPLYALGQNIGMSLMLHGSNDRARLALLTREAATQGVRVLIPLAALLVILSPDLLLLFGPDYAAHGATLMRLLVLGSVPNFVLALAVSVARVQRRLRRALVALGTEAVIALAAATPLLHALGVTGVGLAWVGAQCLVATGLLLTWSSSFHAGSPAAPPEPSADLATREARPLPALSLSDHASSEATALHPILRRLFGALEGGRICWTLLRVPSDPLAPPGDVDILVSPEDTEGLRKVAGELGFVAVPGWESPPDLILVSYDRPSDRWLVLDVSTAVSFRSPPSWRLAGGAEQVLCRRQRLEGMVVPAEADAFWLLLLHCLLDKQRIASHHATRLRRLAPTALGSPLGATVCSAAGGRFAPSALVDAARLGDWNYLSEMGRALVAELRRRRPLRERLRVGVQRLARLARKPLLLPRRKGISVALLGPNGVGKSTAAAGLQRSFPFESRVVYMGVWKAADRARGRVMTVLEIVFRPLQIWRRYLVAQYHQLRGRLVVFDRYVYEALLPPRPPLLAAKRAYFWFLAHSIPQAGAAAVLDVPGPVAYGRKQENPADELESERRVYARLPTRMASLELVDAGADAEAVRAALTTIVWRELAARWRARGKS